MMKEDKYFLRQGLEQVARNPDGSGGIEDYC